MSNMFTGDFTNCKDFKQWHVHWIVEQHDGSYKAYEPDDDCIYEGVHLNDACIALNNSTFGD